MDIHGETIRLARVNLYYNIICIYQGCVRVLFVCGRGDGRRVVTLRFLQNNDYSVFFYCIIILLRLLLVLE